MNTARLFVLVCCLAASCGARAEGWNWNDYADGAKVEIPSGTTVEVNDADLAKVNKLTLSFADLTSVVRFNTAQPLACALTGRGTVCKTTDADWTLSVAQTGFTGNFIVEKGIVRYAHANNFGAQHYATDANPNGYLEICDGAQIEVGCGGYSSNQFTGREVRACGVGPDGRGAIINEVLRATYTFVYLTLTGDTTIGMYKDRNYLIGVALRAANHPSVLDMGGHTLTVKDPANATFFLRDGSIRNGGPILVDGSSASLVELQGFDAGNATIMKFDKGTNLLLTRAPIEKNPFLFTNSDHTVAFSGASIYGTENGWNTNLNNLAGPVTLAGDSKFYMNSSGLTVEEEMLTFSGPLHGGGSVSNNYFGTIAFAQKSLPEDFTGRLELRGTVGGSLFAFHPGFIDYSRIALSAGFISVPMSEDAADEAWSRSDVMQLANGADLRGGAVVAVNTSQLADKAAEIELSDADVTAPSFGLGHSGPGSLTLTGTFGLGDEIKPALGCFDGLLTVTGEGEKWPGDVNVRSSFGFTAPKLVVENTRLTLTNSLTLGGWTGASQVTNRLGVVATGEMTIRNATIMNRETRYEKNVPVERLAGGTPKTFDTATARYGDGFRIGCYGYGILNIEDGAVITNNIQVGTSDSANGGGSGAVYQRGGSVVVRGSPRDQPNYFRYGFIGTSSANGYWELTGGTLSFTGYCDIGDSSTSQGLLYIDNGATATTDNEPVSGKQIFAIGDAGRGHLYVRNGAFRQDAGSTYCPLGAGIGMLTAEGKDAQIWIGPTFCGQQTAGKAYINLIDEGVVAVSGIGKRNNGTSPDKCVFVSFNGGVLRARSDSNSYFGNGYGTDHVTIYAGGAKFDTQAYNVTITTNVLEGAFGNGVVSVPLPPEFATRPVVGPPWVEIADDEKRGYGATAAATWDKATQRMTGVKVLTPGVGYSDNVTATVRYGTYTATVKCTVGANLPDGGLVKRGTGTLTLCPTNTFVGPVTLEGGKVVFASDGALPASSTVVLAGGTFGTSGGAARPTKFAVDLETAIAAGKDGVAYADDIAFPEGSTLEVLHASARTQVEKGQTLVTFSGTVTGTPTVTGLDADPDWKIVWTGKSLRYKKVSGALLIVK